MWSSCETNGGNLTKREFLGPYIDYDCFVKREVNSGKDVDYELRIKVKVREGNNYGEIIDVGAIHHFLMRSLCWITKNYVYKKYGLPKDGGKKLINIESVLKKWYKKNEKRVNESGIYR